MYMKKCPKCSEKAYSSDGRGFWECSRCGEDITDVKKQVTAIEKDKEKYIIQYWSQGEWNDFKKFDNVEDMNEYWTLGKFGELWRVVKVIK